MVGMAGHKMKQQQLYRETETDRQRETQIPSEVEMKMTVMAGLTGWGGGGGGVEKTQRRPTEAGMMLMEWQVLGWVEEDGFKPSLARQCY